MLIRKLWALALTVGLVVSHSASSNAQEDTAEDHGSRAVKKGKSHKARGRARKSDRKAKHWEWDGELGVFGGTYVQPGRWAPLINASVQGGPVLDGHDLSLELSYGYDPFSTKTFNFPEEETASPDLRLTQPTHELAATVRYAHRWHPWFATSVRLRADWWLPELPIDERRALRLAPEFRVGKATGVYVSLTPDGFYKRFPNYEIEDRRLDQQGVDTTGELGYVLGPYNRVAAGVDVNYTQYADARYDVLQSDGTLERATQSKRYIESSPFIFGSIRPMKAFRTNLRYAYELNDSIHYDRRMTGRTDGELVAKFIPDYFDYRRHRIGWNTQITPADRLAVGTLSEVWFRNFDSYEARDVDNTWTGEKRHDFSLELGVEAAWRLWQFKALGQRHGVFLSAFASHLRRRSNMQREVAIATNFDVTRVFFGVELKDL